MPARSMGIFAAPPSLIVMTEPKVLSGSLPLRSLDAGPDKLRRSMIAITLARLRAHPACPGAGDADRAWSSPEYRPRIGAERPHYASPEGEDRSGICKGQVMNAHAEHRLDAWRGRGSVGGARERVRADIGSFMALWSP